MLYRRISKTLTEKDVKVLLFLCKETFYVKNKEKRKKIMKRYGKPQKSVL